jgi:hypothetical protein
MYDCAEQIEIQMQALRILGFDEHVLKLYLPSKAPSQESTNLMSISGLISLILDWKEKGEYFIGDFIADINICPYCLRDFNFEHDTCIECAYKKAFGRCFSSERYKAIEEFLYDYELSPSPEQFNNALTYLHAKMEELVGCGQ